MCQMCASNEVGHLTGKCYDCGHYNSGQYWNPRYLEFSVQNGRTPDQQDKIDRAGTHKLEFILWCSRNPTV